MKENKSQFKIGAVFSYLTLGMNTLVGVFFTPFIISCLGEAEYGLYQLIGAYAGYLSILDMGMSSAVTKYITKYKHENNKDKEENFLFLMLLYYTIISILVWIIGCIMVGALDDVFAQSLNGTDIIKAQKMFWLLLFSLTVTLYGGIFRGVMNAYERYNATKGAELARVLLRVIVIYAILKKGTNSVGLVAIDTVLNIFFFIYRYMYCRSKLKTRFHYHGIDIAELKEVFFFSFFVFLNLVFDQMNWKIDHTILGIKTSTIAITTYSIGMNFANYFMNFSVAVKSLFLPKVMKMELEGADGDAYTAFMIKTGRMQGYLLFYLYFAFIFFGRQFIQIIMRKDYYESWLSALLIMTGLLIPLLENAGHPILQAKNKHHIYVFVCLVLSIFNALSTWFIVDSKGIVGAAFMTMLSFLLGQCVFLSFYYSYKLKIKMSLFYKEILRANVLPIIIVLIIEVIINNFVVINTWMSFILQALIYSFLYFSSIYFLAMTEEEKRYLFGNLRFRITANSRRDK